jgi:hypothetical protein
VKCQRQLHGAEVGSEMSAVRGHRLNDEISDLAGQVIDFRVRQTTKVARLTDGFESHGDWNATPR